MAEVNVRRMNVSSDLRCCEWFLMICFEKLDSKEVSRISRNSINGNLDNEFEFRISEADAFNPKQQRMRGTSRGTLRH